MHTFLIQNTSGSRSIDLQLNSSFAQGARILSTMQLYRDRWGFSC
jgi:hypothetical protein